MFRFLLTKRSFILFTTFFVGIPSWLVFVLVDAQYAPATSGGFLAFIGVLCLFIGCVGGILAWNLYAKDQVELLRKLQSANRKDQPPPPRA
jgi:hypothetical protein